MYARKPVQAAELLSIGSTGSPAGMVTDTSAGTRTPLGRIRASVPTWGSLYGASAAVGGLLRSSPVMGLVARRAFVLSVVIVVVAVLLIVRAFDVKPLKLTDLTLWPTLTPKLDCSLFKMPTPPTAVPFKSSTTEL